MVGRSGVRWAGVGAVAAVLAVTLAACGGGSGGNSGSGTGKASPTPKVSVDKALAAKVPAAIKSKGTITIGTDSSYAPNEFLAADGKTVEGFDVDLFNAVLAKLGLKAKYESAKFGTIIAGVESGKYDAGVSSFTVNADRMKQANMVTYFSAGIWWATKKGNPQKVSPDAACGKKIAVQTDTVEVDDIQARSKKCTQAGKPAIKIDQYEGQDQATASVASGKDDAMLADSPIVAYALKQSKGQLESLGKIYEAAPYGYVIKKDQLAFAQAIQGALKALMADGTYAKVLDNWGVQVGKIDNPTVNPSVSQ
ncbi:ABC transporter substrate-binding protein [Actinocatenispora thailandica]|uniref:ABC transporter substrate-binding protein n=1 Tax=Actinocatenispora thailandica TaxID=227318 RepID=A0A7R7DP27_9ACTN|nr:ABC transporter substrate-binding protein [Actinocatenispora thailandica]BCJ35030.1 ABC transporter substrate-binding protein [Actinocatenispora thailandica]